MSYESRSSVIKFRGGFCPGGSELLAEPEDETPTILPTPSCALSASPSRSPIGWKSVSGIPKFGLGFMKLRLEGFTGGSGMVMGIYGNEPSFAMDHDDVKNSAFEKRARDGGYGSSGSRVGETVVGVVEGYRCEGGRGI